MPIVTLITDYGTRDHYAGALKGVLLSIAPTAVLVDLTHHVEPYNVSHAAFILWRVWQSYPPGTIHLAVVDPGVGSDRRIIAARYNGRYVVAPDNGLVSLVHQDLGPQALHYVEDARFFLPGRSTTFDGRDVMAPVAAHLANGVDITEFGPVAVDVEMLPVAHAAECIGRSIQGGVLHVDAFGTLVTNISREQIATVFAGLEPADVLVNGGPIGLIRSTFSAVPPGSVLALMGSSGLLEIAVNQGSAADRFGPRAAVRIEVR